MNKFSRVKKIMSQSHNYKLFLGVKQDNKRFL